MAKDENESNQRLKFSEVIIFISKLLIETKVNPPDHEAGSGRVHITNALCALQR